MESTLVPIEIETVLPNFNEIAFEESLGTIDETKHLTVIAVEQRRDNVMAARGLSAIETYTDAGFLLCNTHTALPELHVLVADLAR